MKKMKFAAIVATAVLSAALLCACSDKGENTDTEVVQEETEVAVEPTEEVEVVEEVQEEPTEETPADEGIAVDENGGLVLDEKTESALQVMDSLMMCMFENDYAYEPENPEFFWSALFYEVGNYGYLREGSGMIESDGVEGIAKAYYRVVQEYATGLFEDYSDLLEIPEGTTMVYVNPEDSEQYCFLMGDRGLSAPRLTSWTDNGDGTYSATAEMYGVDDGEVIVTGEFTLIDNPYLDGITDPIFYYTVRDAKITK